MAEYLGYVNPAETKANPTLDWSSVINDVRDTLVKQEETREATRQKAKQETNELYSSLSKISSGQNQGLNGFITNASYQSKSLLGEAYKLYTSGKISGKEYTNIQNNMKGSFTDINDVVKTMQTDYEKYMDLLSKGQTSIIDEYNQKQKGESLDLSNKEFYVDPLTGRGYIGTLKDGKIDQSSLQPPSWIKTNGSTFVGKVDVAKEIAPFTKDLGKFEYVLQKPPAGGVWTTDNIAQKPEFKNFLEDAAKTVASNPYKMATILGQIGDYTITNDPKEAGPNKILMQRDSSTGMNVPMLTEEQKKAAYDSVKNAILSQANQTIRQDENTYRPPAPRGSGGSGSDKEPKYPSIQPTVDAGGNVIIPMSGVNVKTGSITENISDWGRVANSGKLFINYNYPVNVTDAGGNVTKTVQSKQVYEGSPEFNRRLGQLINPSTGKKVRSLDEAMRYVNSISGGGNTSSNKAMSQSDFNSKWAKLKSGQSLVGPDGQTYIKK
jgi:predicted DNA-binding ArsR family transcriptional regulator